MTIAAEIWIATALLHREHPDQQDFSVSEIVARAMEEGLGSGYRPGLPVHASLHCVANKPPNPANHRMLYETGRGRRRLFRQGDDFHPDRGRGAVVPPASEIPEQFRTLLDWYEREYSLNGKRSARKHSSGKAWLRLFGVMDRTDAEAMLAAIEEGCERVENNDR